MAPPPRRATVLETSRVTPQMVRIVLGGDGLQGFGAGAFTDHYVKLRLPDAQGETRTRTYSVRDWDADTGRLTIDFVTHGDTGIAGPWAAAARPGDELDLAGPGGAYAPDPDADWHLLVGDAAVVPAIAASLPRVPAGVPVHVILEVDGPAEQQPLRSPGDLRLTWLHRTQGPGEDADLLLAAVRDLGFPPGRGHVFLHGEASAVRAVRRHLLVDRGLEPAQLSASGYWKLRRTEEGWREDKAEWNRLAAADVEAA